MVSVTAVAAIAIKRYVANSTIKFSTILTKSYHEIIAQILALVAFCSLKLVYHRYIAPCEGLKTESQK